MSITPTDGWKHKDDGIIWDDNDAESSYLPCTIISGHWAERIKSGELLTLEELDLLLEVWKQPSPQPHFAAFLMNHIAAMMRGEG